VLDFLASALWIAFILAASLLWLFFTEVFQLAALARIGPPPGLAVLAVSAFAALSGSCTFAAGLVLIAIRFQRPVVSWFAFPVLLYGAVRAIYALLHDPGPDNFAWSYAVCFSLILAIPPVAMAWSVLAALREERDDRLTSSLHRNTD